MQHHFNTDIAKEYDIVTAVLLDHFYFWIEKNRANDKHFHDGRYWTYNSANALAELFPYLNARQVRYAIQKMVDNNLLMTGNYNENKYDRKLWYAITDFGYSILQNCQMYNINNNIDNSINERPYNTTEKADNIDYNAILNLYHSICISLPKVLKWNDSRKKAIKARFNEGYTIDDFTTLFTKAQNSAFLCGSNDTHWQADFDWLLNSKNACKVLEGKYERTKSTNTTTLYEDNWVQDESGAWRPKK